MNIIFISFSNQFFSYRFSKLIPRCRYRVDGHSLDTIAQPVTQKVSAQQQRASAVQALTATSLRHHSFDSPDRARRSRYE